MSYMWNELHTNDQRANPTEVNFVTVNRKIRKRLFRYTFISSING